jgi:flagellar hook protein FlgE
MPNFSIPLSGLTAESTALSAVANNLSNQNTTGYKDTTVLFSDLFYQTLGTTGEGDPIQVGAGTKVGAMPALFTQGSVESTGVPTDVAIQGSGFFVVQNSDGSINYTRAGDFSVNQNNSLVTANGQQVLGYPAVNGVVNSSAGIAPLQLGAGTISPPSATANVELAANLDASATPGTVWSTPIQIYDSLGNEHTLTCTFTNVAANAWQYQISIPSTDLNPVNGVPQTGILQTGTLGFNGDGVLTDTAAGTAGTPAYTMGTEVGTMGAISDGSSASTQTITATAINATQFAVSGSTSGPLGTATVGTAFSSDAINFTITAGTAPFAAGDTFSVATTATTVGTPTFAEPGVGTMTSVTAGAASVAQTITATAINATQFAVVGSVSGPLGTATAGTPFASSGINFTIGAGATGFDAGDQFTVTTTAGTLGNVTGIPITGLADGASNLTFNWNVLNGTTPIISQVAAPSSATSTEQDGSSSGSLVNFTIGSDGTITGSFSNGKTQALGALALANFANPDGLALQGGTDYTPTLASGAAVNGVPGTGGLGSISGGALELSNVDIATEFANLIVAQRGYEADAKAVTTFDQILQDTIALKQ